MIYFLYGEDTFRARRKIDDLLRPQKEAERGVAWIDFEEGVEQFVQTVLTPSLFGLRPVVIGKNPFALTPASREQVAHALGETATHRQETVDVPAIILWQEGKPNMRTRLFKILATPPVQSQEFPLLSGESLIQFVKHEGLSRGMNLPREVVKELCVRTNNDLRHIHEELHKLASVSAAPTLNDLDLLVASSAPSSIFSLIDTLAQKRKRRAYQLLNELYAQGATPLYVLTMCAYQIRNLMKVKSLLESGISATQIAKAAHLHPFVASKAIPQTTLFSLDELRTLHARLFEAEHAIKQGRIDPVVAVDLLVAQF